MRRKKPETSVLARRSTVENLEERRVLTTFAFDFPFAEPTMSPENWANSVVVGYEHVARRSSESSAPEIGGFASEEEAVSTLKDWVADYWAGLLGQEVNRELYEQYRAGWGWFGAPPSIVPWVGRTTSLVAENHFEGGTLVDFSRASGLQGPVASEVDEADRVEVSAGGLLYAAIGGKLRVFDIRDPENLVEVAVVDNMAHRGELYVAGDRLISLSFNQATIYDLSNNGIPELLSTIQIDGYITSSRLLGDTLMIASTFDVELPRPEFIRADGVGDDLVSIGSTSLGRFETAEEYLDRVSRSLLVGSFLPDVEQKDASGETIYSGDLGDWADLILNGEHFGSRQTSVAVFDVGAEMPNLLDSETLQGVSTDFVHSDADSVYLVDRTSSWAHAWDVPWDTRPDVVTDIYRVSLLDGGADVVADAAGQVDGGISDASMMDEYEGNLRVVTTDAGEFQPGWWWGPPVIWPEPTDNATHLFVLQADGSDLEVIGQLRDIADGQTAFAAYFSGPHAVVTTAEMRGLVPFLDPLHGIDLSNPESPREVSELEIPGVTTHLEWVDESLLVGVGYVENDGQWTRQVSLYDVSDLADPQVADVWVGETSIQPDFFGLRSERQAIHFDRESGTLVLPNSSHGLPRSLGGPDVWEAMRNWTGNLGAQVLQVDSSSETPLKDLGVIAPRELVLRSLVRDGVIFAISGTSIQASPAEAPSEVLDKLYYGNRARLDVTSIHPGESVVIDVLENDLVGPGAVVSSVSASRLGATITISEDGRSIIYEAGEIGDKIDRLTYTVTPAIGEPYEGPLRVIVQPGGSQPTYPNPPQSPEYSDASATISVSVTDEDGNAVTEATIGDRLWIELSVDGDRDIDLGVFQAKLDVAFDRTMLDVVGDPEPIGDFTNAFSAIETDAGYEALGGFSSSVDPLGTGPQRIARFLVEVKQTGTVSIAAKVNLQPGNEILLYGEDHPVNPENVSPAELTLTVVDPPEGESLDVNRDGAMSALDALLVINFLNDESQPTREVSQASGEADTMSALDVNSDGVVSPLDALTIINWLNARPTGEPEGELAAGTANGMAETTDDTLQMLAAAHASAWDMERRR